MTNAIYHVFGLGLGNDDIRYVGWTQRSVDEEEDQIVSDLVNSGLDDVARWVGEAADGARISVFEIESAPSIEDARNCAIYWCQCLDWLGLHVKRVPSLEPDSGA